MSEIEISVVSPVYLAEGVVDRLASELIENLGRVTDKFEIILVDDRSPDGSWAKIIEACEKDSRVVGIRLSRNFGQSRATTAGLARAKGNWVVVMDCDLQDSPADVVRLYEEAKKGYDCVRARRVGRKDSWLRLIISDFNHRVYSFLTDFKTDRTLANFGIYSKRVIQEYLKFKEYYRPLPLIMQYVGFKQHFLETQHRDRYQGKSSYSFGKLFVAGIEAVLSNTTKPLMLTAGLGLFISLASFALAIYRFAMYFLNYEILPGFTTTIFSIWFSTGVIVFILGVIGMYVGKIHEHVKNQPLFTIDEVQNFGTLEMKTGD